MFGIVIFYPAGQPIRNRSGAEKCRMHGEMCIRDRVHLTGLDGGDDAVEGHVHDLQLNAEAVGDLLGQPHIAAGEVGVEILELIGSVPVSYTHLEDFLS